MNVFLWGWGSAARVAAAVLGSEVVELGLEHRRKAVVRGGERIRELLASARSEND
jgi:hypothetical protein